MPTPKSSGERRVTERDAHDRAHVEVARDVDEQRAVVKTLVVTACDVPGVAAHLVDKLVSRVRLGVLKTGALNQPLRSKDRAEFVGTVHST